MPGMMLISEATVVLFVLITLLILSPVVTLCLTLLTALIAIALYFPTRQYNYNLGSAMRRESLETNKYALQGLKAIKESKIRNVEPFFISEYTQHQEARNRIYAIQSFISGTPRFIIEAALVSLGLGALASLILSGVAAGSIILTLSLLAVSMIRLMPSFTRIQYALTLIRQNQPILEQYHAEILTLSP